MHVCTGRAVTSQSTNGQADRQAADGSCKIGRPVCSHSYPRKESNPPVVSKSVRYDESDVREWRESGRKQRAQQLRQRESRLTWPYPRTAPYLTYGDPVQGRETAGTRITAEGLNGWPVGWHVAKEAVGQVLFPIHPVCPPPSPVVGLRLELKLAHACLLASSHASSPVAYVGGDPGMLQRASANPTLRLLSTSIRGTSPYTACILLTLSKWRRPRSPLLARLPAMRAGSILVTSQLPVSCVPLSPFAYAYAAGRPLIDGSPLARRAEHGVNMFHSRPDPEDYSIENHYSAQMQSHLRFNLTSFFQLLAQRLPKKLGYTPDQFHLISHLPPFSFVAVSSWTTKTCLTPPGMITNYNGSRIPTATPSTEVMFRLDPSNADDRRASDVMWNHFAKEVSQLLNPWTANVHNLNGLFRPYDTHVLSIFSFYFLLVKALKTSPLDQIFLNHIAVNVINDDNVKEEKRCEICSRRTKRNGRHFFFVPFKCTLCRATGVDLAERSNVFFLWLQTARMAGSSLPGTFWIWVAADQALTLLSETVNGDLVAAPALRTTTPLTFPRLTIGRAEMEDSASSMRAHTARVVNHEVGVTEARHRNTFGYCAWRTTGWFSLLVVVGQVCFDRLKTTGPSCTGRLPSFGFRLLPSAGGTPYQGSPTGHKHSEGGRPGSSEDHGAPWHLVFRPPLFSCACRSPLLMDNRMPRQFLNSWWERARKAIDIRRKYSLGLGSRYVAVALPWPRLCSFSSGYFRLQFVIPQDDVRDMVAGSGKRGLFTSSLRRLKNCHGKATRAMGSASRKRGGGGG
ncbi:uncharacterized protein CLUP02_10104 [Colletotrichum lupini]|uniref:Uncharacterized protein n=1 Tax=Colletotrichum lupini TaxID=145971 RepID=A0A9Q8WJ21_9PEZI|nr:uncharacterized protein CLUP02_10104 [Colletotrichum lupini]UQC84607.1 hypothetical protein CLUP02_10104 [Colletotrichum lupini]